MNNKNTKKTRILFLGSKRVGYKVLKILRKNLKENLVGCITINDSSDSRSELNSITDYCTHYGIRHDIIKTYEDPSEYIKKYIPDLCFVVGWYSIIPQSIINQVVGGFIGVHNSLLPSYRGQAPLVWAMINGEKKVGFSVFSLDSGLDTGDIWYQYEVEVAQTDYIQDVLDKIETGVKNFFENEVENIVTGKIKPYKQSLSNISYGAKRTEHDGKIDWSWNANQIFNFVRAQSEPYPGAFTEYNGKRYKILNCEIFGYQTYGVPGQILLIEKESGSVVIVCGNNSAIKIRFLYTNKELIASTVITNLSTKMS